MRSRLSRLALILAVLTALVLASTLPVSAGKANLGSVIAAPKSINFGQVPVYSDSDSTTVWMFNNTKAFLYLNDYWFAGKDEDDFNFTDAYNDCYYIYYYGEPLAPGESCSWMLYMYADESGGHNASLVNEWWDGARYFYSSVGLRGYAFWD